MYVFHPATETADASRVGIENLDVMTSWTEHTDELASSEA
jgi:hypothetical protein